MRHLILFTLSLVFVGCEGTLSMGKDGAGGQSDSGEQAWDSRQDNGCGSELENCHPDANCTTDEDDAGHICICKDGYEGNGLECSNINECATGVDDCHANATCTDSDGGFSCACKPGYEGDGRDCRSEVCESPVGDFDGTDNRDITFLAFGDTQVALVDAPGCAQYGGYRADQQRWMIAALNGISGQTWPEGYDLHREGRAINEIRGVLIAGDVTENGSEPRAVDYPGYVPDSVCDEFTPFEEAYGVCGERELNYPVYEGYGNHDFPYSSDSGSEHHPVIGRIGARTSRRANVVRAAPVEEAHYAWKWDDIHFVNLNVKPSGHGSDRAVAEKYRDSKGYRRVDPHFALDFLDEYLDAAEEDAQVVIMSHYGPYNSSRFPDEERDAFCDVLEEHEEDGKRVVAWIHGHTHKSDFYEWECPSDYDVEEIPVFNVGSPYYAKEENAESVHFTLFRLGNRTLEALDISARLGDDGVPVFQMPGVSTENDNDDDNPDGLYGGWVEVLERHLRRPE
ncbi:MAG: EGF domain-containing protein [Myxococcota bacterium]|nr:EGF domain-containing protein [Myxococcota bacterium]